MEGLLDEKRNKELIILADLEKKENPAVEKGMDDHLQKKLKELDKESNTMEYSGTWAKVIAVICICFSFPDLYRFLRRTGRYDPAVYPSVFRYFSGISLMPH